jgi:hypothetical protein
MEVTRSAVCDAIRKFDNENELCEATLLGLFKSKPLNDNPNDVYLKIIALNTLYSTQIRLYSTQYPTMEDIAKQIVSNHQRIDVAISEGDPEAVDLIGNIRVEGKEKQMDYFVFATKYCSWSHPEKFPIFDSRVGVSAVSV